MIDKILGFIKKFIPKKVFGYFQPTYHKFLAWAGAKYYDFPSHKIKVIFITGTKGKSSTTEILAGILTAGGKKVASASTIQFNIDGKSWPNKFKMTTPGRFFLQRFLYQAVKAGCEYAVVEMSSEAAKQFRHRYINFDALLFLNISPEHIESHGGYENYLAAKLSLAHALENSPKRPRVLVVNKDDKESQKFLAVSVENKILFSLHSAEPYTLDHFGSYFTFKGRNLRTHLQGVFNISNILAALSYADTQGISLSDMQKGLDKLTGIAGRVQKIRLPTENPNASKQDFNVIVDYAHTADSLEKVYAVFKDSKKICVLGNTGGGRDKWKRPQMAKVANDNCSHIILTNEDPYDENPDAIIKEMLPGISHTPYEIIMDRRTALNKAISMAKVWREKDRNTDVSVVITGKGTDPYIMEAGGKKTPWSDAKVAQEELEKVLDK